MNRPGTSGSWPLCRSESGQLVLASTCILSVPTRRVRYARCLRGLGYLCELGRLASLECLIPCPTRGFFFLIHIELVCLFNGCNVACSIVGCLVIEVMYNSLNINLHNISWIRNVLLLANKGSQDKYGPFGLIACSIGLCLNFLLSFSLSILVVGVGCPSRAVNICSVFIQRWSGNHFMSRFVETLGDK